MHKITAIALLIISMSIFGGCKKQKLAPEEIRPLVGRWNLEAIESTGMIKKWETISAEQSDAFQIRYDGVILNRNGLGNCCSPRSITFNQKVFLIEAKEPIQLNTTCATIYCSSCETLDVELKSDTLIVTSCFGERIRFRYVKG